MGTVIRSPLAHREPVRPVPVFSFPVFFEIQLKYPYNFQKITNFHISFISQTFFFLFSFFFCIVFFMFLSFCSWRNIFFLFVEVLILKKRKRKNKRKNLNCQLITKINQLHTFVIYVLHKNDIVTENAFWQPYTFTSITHENSENSSTLYKKSLSEKLKNFVLFCEHLWSFYPNTPKYKSKRYRFYKKWFCFKKKSYSHPTIFFKFWSMH